MPRLRLFLVPGHARLRSEVRRGLGGGSSAETGPVSVYREFHRIFRGSDWSTRGPRFSLRHHDKLVCIARLYVTTMDGIILLLTPAPTKDQVALGALSCVFMA